MDSSTWLASATSNATGVALPPCSRISSATLLAGPSVRSLTTTWAPRSASSLAIALPNPRAAPVTTANLRTGFARLMPSDACC